MQIVIDIPEKYYKIIMDSRREIESLTYPGEDAFMPDVAIINGTPLPKGHGRLIDADLLVKRYGLEDATQYSNKGTMMLYEIAEMIDDAPTIVEADKGVEE